MRDRARNLRKMALKMKASVGWRMRYMEARKAAVIAESM